MNMIKNLIIRYRELIEYAFFGVCTTVVNLISFKIFNVILGVENYLISNVIAWFFSVLFAYITNKVFVFKSGSWERKVIIKEIFSFFSSRVLTFLIEEFGLYLLVDTAGLGGKQFNVLTFDLGGEMIAKVLVAVVVVILNYIFSKMFIFKKNK